MTIKNKANELYIIREFNAPLALVWEAWTDTQHIGEWWGPRGFTLTTHSKDLITGGHWNYTMHGPDGTDYPNRTYYHEVIPYKRLVYDHGANESQPPLFKVTVEFTERAEKTLMEMTMSLATPEEAQEIKKFIKSAGGDSTWDRLTEYIEKKKTNREIFTINRSFQAPREMVFNAWTDPQQLASWLAPSGVKMEITKGEIRQGTQTFYRMFNDSGFNMYGKIFYKSIQPSTQLVYTQQFTDSNGQVARHPMSPSWPETMHTHIEFADEEMGTTRVKITWSPDESSSTEELQTFIKERTGMTQGWTGSLNKLEEFLAQLNH